MKTSISHPLSQALCTLTALFALAACGGGGSPAPAPGPSAPAPGGDLSGQPAPAPAGQNQFAQSFADCPVGSAITSPDSRTCLTGRYEGKNAFNGEACTVTIAGDGTISLDSANLKDSFGLPYGSVNYSKVEYTTTLGTGAPDFALLWLAAGDFNSIHRDAKVFLKFNESLKGGLSIEYSKDRNNSVNCSISKVS